MNEPGKLLIAIGLLLTIVGLIMTTGIGKQSLGRLPGDISWSRGSFSLHFPLVTCLIVSAILSLLMWFFRR